MSTKSERKRRVKARKQAASRQQVQEDNERYIHYAVVSGNGEERIIRIGRPDENEYDQNFEQFKRSIKGDYTNIFPLV